MAPRSVAACSYGRLQQQSRRNKLRGRLDTNRLFILLASLSGSSNSSNTPTTLLQPPQNGADPIPMSRAKSRDIAEDGVVDEFIFFGKDGTQDEKEETVCLTVSPEEPPPPGQLFFLQSRGPNGPPEPPPTDAPTTLPGPDDAEGTADTSLCHLYHHVSHDFLEIRFKIQRLLELRQYMLLPPEHVLVKIFSFLPRRALVALKCTCHHFKGIIKAFGIRATDSRWV